MCIWPGIILNWTYLVVSGSVLTLVFEVIVFALIAKRFAANLSTMRRLNVKTPLTTLLWRDGMLLMPRQISRH